MPDQWLGQMSKRAKRLHMYVSYAVVITATLRTPLCKAKKGQFKDTSSNELLVSLFQATKRNIGIDPALIGDMCVLHIFLFLFRYFHSDKANANSCLGTVITPDAPYVARAAALAAGFRRSRHDSCVHSLLKVSHHNS